MRAYSYESVLVLLHGADGGTGFLPIPGQMPIPQPNDQRVLQFPQVVGFNIETVDPNALAFLQVEGFHVEFSGAIDPYFTHRLSGD